MRLEGVGSGAAKERPHNHKFISKTSINGSIT